MEVRIDRTEILIGRADLDGHDRLHQLRLTFLSRLGECDPRGVLKSDVGALRFVLFGMEQRRLPFDHRISKKRTAQCGVFHARLNRRKKLRIDRPFRYLVAERLIGIVAARRRFNPKSHNRKLRLATDLLDEPLFNFRGF